MAMVAGHSVVCLVVWSLRRLMREELNSVVGGARSLLGGLRLVLRR